MSYLLSDPCMASRLLREGKVVALPTETVYGLAAAVDQPLAMERIFSLKGRPTSHPLIVHVVQDQAATCFDVMPDAAWRLAEAFWPGPLTLVGPRATWVPDTITGGQSTVAVRCPNHRLTQAVLEDLGVPVVAPSANRYCHISPTQASDVCQAFPSIHVLEGQACAVGIESTIVAVEDDVLRVLRLGTLTPAALEAASGLPVILGGAHRVPGQVARHYAPGKPCWYTPSLPEELRGSWSVLTWGRWRCPGVEVFDLPNDPGGYAQGLYRMLRAADASARDEILIHLPVDAPEWWGVRDRIMRAGRALSDKRG